MYSTYVTAVIREKLQSVSYGGDPFKLDVEEYESEMRRVYKSVSDGCITLQKKMGRYTEDRMSRYEENEEEIKKVLAQMPKAQEIAGIIEKIGLSLDSFFEVYGGDVISDAVKYAKDLKDRYTVLWMYYDVFGRKELF